MTPTIKYFWESIVIRLYYRYQADSTSPSNGRPVCVKRTMEDELEDRVLYQTYVSHAKLMSRLAVPLNAGYMWRFLRVYVLKPEVLVFSAILFFVVVYIQAVDVWSRGVLERLQYGAARSASKVRYLGGGGGGGGEKLSWELREGNVAAFAVQGRRPRMEDRFVVHDNVNRTGVSLFAVFDGHGGEVSTVRVCV